MVHICKIWIFGIHKKILYLPDMRDMAEVIDVKTLVELDTNGKFIMLCCNRKGFELYLRFPILNKKIDLIQLQVGHG